MKRILTIILLLVSFVGLGQNNNFPNKPTQGSTKTSNQFLGQVSAQRGVSGGIFRDTIAANDSAYVKSKSFNIIHTTSDNNTWYRSADTLRWDLFATTSSNCGGTRLIDGSITWSGVGYIFNATVLHYGIICGLYTSDTTTLTVSPSDPTYPRIDVFYADTSGNVGIITGTPSPTPVKPSVNPLSQIEVSFVYVPAGSVTPPQTATIIYNENIEWAGASNVPSINFAYTINPYDGLVSTYFSSMASGTFISYQNGSVLNINNYQYLKFYFRRNSALGSDPASTLVLDFYNGNTLITNSLFINDGAYGYDASVIGSYQLIVVPISSFTFADSLFDKLYITNTTGSLSSCQLDKIYLLGSVPPPPVISNSWVRPGNANTNPVTDRVGTTDSTQLNIGANSRFDLIVPADGINFTPDSSTHILVRDPITNKLYWIYQPSIYALGCLKIYDSTSSGITRKYIRDTCSGGGGSTPGLNAVTLVDSTSQPGIKIATAPAVSVGQATLFADSWGAGYGLPNLSLAWFNLVCNFYGWRINNASLSSSTLMKRVIVDPYGAQNMIDRIPFIPYYGTGLDVIGSKLIFAYGLNDVRWNGANYTTTNFVADFHTIIDSCIARGWSTSDIIFVSTGYIPPTTYTSYGGNPAATLARQKSFDSCISVVATTYGSKYFDAYSFMESNGARTLMQSDSIHPNTQGNKVYALGFIANYGEPVRFGSQKLAVNGSSEFSSPMKFTNLPTTHSKKAIELVADSNGVLSASTLRHLYYNAFGNVEIGDNADSIPYRLSVDGPGYINDGINISNKYATEYKKWLRLYGNYTTGESLIDAFSPSGGNADLRLQSSSKGKLYFSSVGVSQTNSGGSYADTAGMHFGHTVIKGFNSPFFEGMNLMYIAPNGSFITANSSPSVYDNLALQAFGGNVSIGKYPGTARLHIAAGTATASTAPLKFTAGTNLTTPEAGAVEFDGTHFYGTIGSTRYQLDQQGGGGGEDLDATLALGNVSPRSIFLNNDTSSFSVQNTTGIQNVVLSTDGASSGSGKISLLNSDGFIATITASGMNNNATLTIPRTSGYATVSVNGVASDIAGSISLTPTSGATGQTAYTTGDILYSSATNTLSRLSIGTSKQALRVVSGVPAWRDTTALTLANLGGLGTGVATALAVNTGSAGAPVLFNGAGGTPSSLTLTSATGLPLTTGVTGILPVANGGTNASSAGITAFNNITGYTASGATGTTSTNLVFSTSPTLVTPILGTPTSGTLTNCTGLPIAGTTGYGTGVATALAVATNAIGGMLTGASSFSANVLTVLSDFRPTKTITAAGTTGAQTINKTTGTVNFAAGASTLVVTNSFATANSVVIVTVYGTDATATSARVTKASGSFTITLNAAATAETAVGFMVTN